MAITVVTTLVNMVAGFVLGLVLSVLMGAVSYFGLIDAVPNPEVFLAIIWIPISPLVFAGTVTAMLPTSFGKGLLIALLSLAIAFAVIVVGVGGGVMLAMGMKMGG